MIPAVRNVASLTLLSQISLVLACSGGGPSDPVVVADAHLSGFFTTSDVSEAGAGGAFIGTRGLAGAPLALLAPDGSTVLSLTTGPTGGFSAAVSPGTYVVSLGMSVGPPLQFELNLPPGGALFAAGRVDQTPAGAFTLNVQVFRDGDSDASPDDPFQLQILDLAAGDPGSGTQDVVTTSEEAAESVTLCHVPPGNPDAAHTVTVGAPAVPAHLAHGDAEGACEGEPTDEGEEEGEDAEVKVLVCHVPPGNPDNPQTIEVGESALPAHLAHGDTEGACEGDEGTGEDPAEDGEENAEVKVLVCHVPPGNPDNPQTIEIGESALPAHLAHGDTEGECPEVAPADEGEGEGNGG
jgi:hypothetical protein